MKILGITMMSTYDGNWKLLIETTYKLQFPDFRWAGGFQISGVSGLHHGPSGQSRVKSSLVNGENACHQLLMFRTGG